VSKWILEVWANGPEGAAKVTTMHDEEPTRTLIANMEGAATGAYRRCYQEWPKAWGGLLTHGHKITPPAN
jgi:hypothetical protein